MQISLLTLTVTAHSGNEQVASYSVHTCNCKLDYFYILKGYQVFLSFQVPFYSPHLSRWALGGFLDFILFYFIFECCLTSSSEYCRGRTWHCCLECNAYTKVGLLVCYTLQNQICCFSYFHPSFSVPVLEFLEYCLSVHMPNLIVSKADTVVLAIKTLQLVCRVMGKAALLPECLWAQVRIPS